MGVLMTKVYAAASLVDALELQEKLRVACGFPCCQCHVTPSKDCPCTDHRDGKGRILPGPHSALSVATEAVDVKENPKMRGEYFVGVPTAYEKHLAAEDRAPLTEKVLADVTVATLAEPIDEKPTEDPKLADPLIEAEITKG